MPQKLRGHVTLTMSPLQKIFKGSRCDCPLNTRATLGVRNIMHFNDVILWLDWPVHCSHTDWLTHIWWKHYLHWVHLVR